jgi:hypothetical protein
VEIRGEGLDGPVVTLGQQLLEDGATVKVVDGDGESEEPRP